MRIPLCLFFIIFNSFSSTAQLKITPIKGINHSFPYIEGANKKAVEKINHLLQSELLGNDTVQTGAEKIFLNSVFIDTNSQQTSGLSQIGYEIALNDGRFLSIKFDMETSGAYMEAYPKYYSFYAQTGDPVQAKDLLTPGGIKWLKKHLVNERAKRIKKFLKEKEYEPQDSALVRETFEECNKEPQEVFLFIKRNSLYFFKEFCFPHYYRLIDDNLDVELTFKLIQKYLSAGGKKLIH